MKNLNMTEEKELEIFPILYKNKLVIDSSVVKFHRWISS